MLDDGSYSGGEAGSRSIGGTATGTGGASNGGKVGRGGAPSSAGSQAVGGGVSVGGIATAGTFGVAGTTSSGGGCVCPIIQCAPGFNLVPDPNGCCFHCESQCERVMCPGIACGPGSHLEALDGQCCPTCVQDSCVAQRAAYTQFRDQVMEKYSSLGCKADSDCSYIYEKNNCALGCAMPVPARVTREVDELLRTYAQQNCDPNCMLPSPPCVPASEPSCWKYWCE